MNQVILKVENLTSVYNYGKITLNNTNKLPTLSKGEISLHPCSFEIYKNSIVAILGPSGCGKSTLLKTLVGINQIASGKIHFNGYDLSKNYDYLKTYIGYVPQNDSDAIHFDLTLYQCLELTARLRLSDLSISEQDNRIKEVISKLQLGDIKNKIIKNLSGGQIKRVSIASEMLIKPKILFLDEPTSPLDPQMVSDFLMTLKKIAKEGTTILIVTHKPEDIDFMDECIFMGKGGFLCFKGKKNELFTYFNTTNILDIFKVLNSKKNHEYAKKYYFNEPNNKNSYTNKNIILDEYRNINYISQFKNLLYRLYLRKTNDYVSFLITLIQAPFISLLLVLIFEKLDQFVLFFTSISSIFFGINNASKEIITEINIFKRERMYNQGIHPYIISKVVFLSLLGLIQSTLFITIIYYAYHYNNSHVIDYLGMIFWMTFSISISSILGLVLSAVSKNSESVMSKIPIALIPQIMLSGIISKITTSKLVTFLSYFTISRWIITGFARIQPTIELAEISGLKKTIKIISIQMGNTYDEYLKTKYNFPFFEFVILLIHGLFYYLIVYMSLKIKDSNHRKLTL